MAQLLHLGGGGAGEEGAARMLAAQHLAPARVADSRAFRQLVLLAHKQIVKKNYLKNNNNNNLIIKFC